MMTYFKRWTSGLVSRVDSVVVQLENQESLVQSAIADMSQRIARARVQLTRVGRDGETLKRRTEEAERSAELWRNRARSEPEQARALECLRRSKRAAVAGEEYRERLLVHQRSEKRLRQDVLTIEQRLEQLREQRNTMRTRQSRAEALAILQGGGEGCFELEQVLERWDARITESELVAGCANEDIDSFSDEFCQQESNAELIAELHELKQVKS